MIGRIALLAVLALPVALGACSDDKKADDGDLLERFAASQERKKELEEERRAKAAAANETDIEVTLPSGNKATFERSRASVVVDITQDGDLAVNGRALSSDQLDSVLQAAYERDPEAQILVRPAKGTNHAAVVAVLERAKRVGFSRVGAQAAPSGE